MTADEFAESLSTMCDGAAGFVLKGSVLTVLTAEGECFDVTFTKRT